MTELIVHIISFRHKRSLSSDSPVSKMLSNPQIKEDSPPHTSTTSTQNPYPGRKSWSLCFSQPSFPGPPGPLLLRTSHRTPSLSWASCPFAAEDKPQNSISILLPVQACKPLLGSCYSPCSCSAPLLPVSSSEFSHSPFFSPFFLLKVSIY